MEAERKTNYMATLTANSTEFQRDPATGHMCPRWNVVRRDQKFQLLMLHVQTEA